MHTVYSLLNKLVLILTLYLAITASFTNAKPIHNDPPWPVQCPVVLGAGPCDLI